MVLSTWSYLVQSTAILEIKLHISHIRLRFDYAKEWNKSQEGRPNEMWMPVYEMENISRDFPLAAIFVSVVSTAVWLT